MATLEKLRPRPEATSSGLKDEVNEYLQRASNLERQRQHDEAAILYRRVVSLIQSHENTSTVDEELSSMKRHANQLLLQSSLNRGQSSTTQGAYQTMVRQLSSHVPQTTDDDERDDQIFEDPAAFQPVEGHQRDGIQGNATVLLQLDAGAKLFYLARDGSIQTTSETLPLTVFQVTYV